MNVYADTSALVKGYVRERGSDEFMNLVRAATEIATSLITRAELAASFGKAVRAGAIPEHIARRLLLAFREEWPSWTKLYVLEALVARADGFAYDYGLRGYDAIHLASAVSWQESLRSPIVLATFDQEVWTVARQVGLEVFPTDLTPFLGNTTRRS